MRRVWQNLFVLHLLIALVSVTDPSLLPVSHGPLVAPAAAFQSAAAAERVAPTRVLVALPTEDAELVVDGQATAGTGSLRDLQVRSQAAGSTHTFSVTWKPNTYTTMTRTKTVTARAGEPLRVDLTIDDPGDRVRVIYVPTPADVAEAMVDLAGVRADDVVYEPGCGDARITIAAIRKGARRGLCVDIDPERASESRANVAAAGLADRIEVREGDALDVKDLSDVSVVMLYMGDHFDMLIRPVLWRDLKVGSRIVSHRFTMGDWPPDQTVTVTSASDGIPYELHLWTITEDIKKRQR
jgi:uncharacterized protein (TIGR03000 family)